MHDETINRPSDPGSDDDQRALNLIMGAREGKEAAIGELVDLIYPELKRRAQWLMTGERSGHTFGSSGRELVQRVMEQMLMAGGRVFAAVNTEEELIRLLTRRMRWVLLDYARKSRTHGKPAPRSRVDMEVVERVKKAAVVDAEAVIRTDEALTKLEETDAEAAQAIELRIFTGFTNDEAAAAMGLNVAAFRRTLSRGKAFLRALLEAPAASRQPERH